MVGQLLPEVAAVIASGRPCKPCETAECPNYTPDGTCALCRSRPKGTAWASTTLEPVASPEKIRWELRPNTLHLTIGKEPLTGTLLAVFEALCAFDFNGEGCCPSEATLAEYAGVSRITVVRAKAQLRALGWIDWTHAWHNPRSRWMHCVYTILAGWVRPFRKPVLKWLDNRRSRANDALNELPRPHVEKETQRSKARRVRNGFSRPWEGWLRKELPPVPQVRTAVKVSEDEIRRAGGQSRAEAFASWTPLALTG